MSAHVAERSPRRQWLVLGAIFAVVVGLLALGYFLFLRPTYVVLVEGLRPGDAQPIVTELDKRGTPYRVTDGGGTILVPEGQADATRVAIAGSDAMARGEIGFELFNKSDMGLTNFAQKINYLRALQGELVRTIMLEDGVESARVHLALPEHTLFRADRSEPKAAVTLAMKPGQTADAARVAGIQRLVAAAVPDLPETKVVVLDSEGRVISPTVAATDVEADRSPDVEEKAAVENYYRARARGAIERQMPGLKFTVRVLALPIGEGAAPSDPAAAASAGWVPSGEGASRNFRMRLIFVSEAALGGDDQEVVRSAVSQATALNATQGDSLSFEVGPVDPLPETGQPVATAPPKVAPPVSSPEPAPVRVEWTETWIWIAGALVIALLVIWRLRGTGAARLADGDHEAFAARLRRQLNLEDGDAVA